MAKVFVDNDTPDGMNYNPKPNISIPHDMPLGLGMSLNMNSKAQNYYYSLDEDTKQRIIQNIVCCTTGEEAKRKVKTAVSSLADHNLDFLG